MYSYGSIRSKEETTITTRNQQEQQQQLENQITILTNPRGRSLTTESNSLLLRIMLQAKSDHQLNQTPMLYLVTHLTGISYATLHRLYRHYLDSGEVLIIDSTNRGAGSSKHIYHDSDLNMEQICSIHQFLLDRSNAGELCTARNVIEHLKEEFNIKISIRTTQRIMLKIGYRYGKANFIGAMNDEARRKRIRTFIHQYSAALNNNQTVIIYTDESYVNANHSSCYTWYAPASIQRNNVKKPSGRGKRLIILIGISLNGPIVSRDKKKQPITCSDNIDEKCLSAELIFEAVEHDGDYHQCMNGEIYMKWLENRLIPTFKKLFSNKKMALILDNASYHHVRGEDWISPNTMRKLELACKLSELGISHMTVTRIDNQGVIKHFRFGQNAFFENASKWAPTVDEMKQRLKQFLVDNPGFQKTEVQKLFDKHGFQLIYTPPYTPTTQPIELIWSYVKGYVARRFTNNRTMEMLRVQTLAGMYGDSANKHEGVTAELCKKVINKCQRWCNSFLQTDSELGGSLSALTKNPGIQYSAPDIDDDEDQEADPFAGEAVESDDEDD